MSLAMDGQHHKESTVVDLVDELTEEDKAIVPLIDLTRELAADGVVATALAEGPTVTVANESCSESDSPRLWPICQQVLNVLERMDRLLHATTRDATSMQPQVSVSLAGVAARCVSVRSGLACRRQHALCWSAANGRGVRATLIGF